MLVPLDREKPLAAQIYAHFARAIRAGELRPDQRLPPSRRLAATHSLARNTVIAAYQQLAAEGYVETRGAGGTIVARDLPRAGLERAALRPSRAHASRAGRFSAAGRRARKHGRIFAPLTTRERTNLRWDFEYNASVADPSSRRAWTRLMRGFVRSWESSRGGWDPAKRPGPLHEQIARYLRLTRRVNARADQVMLVGSVQAALRIVADIVLAPGDLAVLEDPHYVGVRNTLRARGARVHAVPVDDRGLRVDLLPSGGRPRLAYVAPSHNWPTGAALPLARRLEVLAWAKRHRAWIIENDHNCEYFYAGTPAESIQGLDDSGRVIYMGTFSRLLEPYPTISYAVVPDAMIDSFRAESILSGAVFSVVEREALAAFLANGEMEKLLRRASRRMRALQQIVLRELRRLPCAVETAASSGGLHVYAGLPGWTVAQVDELVDAAARAGVGIYPGAPFFMRRPEVPGVLLGFAWLDAHEIRDGIARLADVVRELRGASSPA